jgi:hypothetical protein
VLSSALRAQLKRNEGDAEAARKLLPSAIGAKDRAKTTSYVNKMIACSRRAAALAELLKDLNRLKDGAAAICANAAADRGREKTVSPEYAPSFRRLCCAADGLRLPELVDFKSKIIIALYGRAPTDSLSRRADLEPTTAQALFDEAPTEAEVRQAYVDYAAAHPDSAAALEIICGFPLAPMGAPAGPPPFAPPGRATQGQMAPPPLGVGAAGCQSYRTDVYLPLDLPPFARESWGALLDQVARAVH